MSDNSAISSARNALKKEFEAAKDKSTVLRSKHLGQLYSILKDAPNKELAYEFINYMLDPQVYAKVVEFFRFPSIIPDAMKYTEVKPFYELKDIMKFEFKEDVGAAIENYDKVWQEVKVGQ